ncbi:MAG: 4-(cytidine 5'-diphospho)-2-C-methyl-D-erythritol kinase [Lachnospirales bacterium]
MSIYTYKSYAKVNFALDIVSRRDDGYHKLKTIMQRISMYDILTFEKNDSSKVTISSNIDISDEQDNLVYKGANKIFDFADKDLNKGLHIHIEKHIPMQAGLGGGSSNCGTTLLAINEIYELGLSKETLVDIGASLGADVPFFLYNTPMLCTGIGEILEPVNPCPKCFVLVAKPKFSISTAKIFKGLNPDSFFENPKFENVIKGFCDNDIDLISKNLFNKLEDVSIALYPQIQAIKDIMLNSGGKATLMSGSGSSVFGIFEKEENALLCKGSLDKSDINFDRIQVCTPIN